MTCEFCVPFCVSVCVLGVGRCGGVGIGKVSIGKCSDCVYVCPFFVRVGMWELGR